MTSLEIPLFLIFPKINH